LSSQFPYFLMTANLPPQYTAKETEAKWQSLWESRQTYRAATDAPGEKFCVVIPPPNVTGSLHMGHAFEHTLIDVLVRYQRMTGHNTLWVPGTDHASIAVQTILEKQLQTAGLKKNEVGREEFLNRAWQWKETSGSTIVGQQRRLGLSVDWTRERFTMDEGLSKAVLTAFTEMHRAGLIYRGNYLVSWCPASQSAVSDIEVENKEVNGYLWHFRYPLSDGSGHLEVATTRPETMLGDTAVAVNPADDRYRHLIGKTLTLPLVGRQIPIVGDELVEMEFGTGCVKVTPAHDPNDFAMGQRHQLEFINILNKDGSINENGGNFVGQDRFVARKNVVAALEAAGNLVKIEDYKHTVPYSDRGKVPIEPLLSTQWFVKVRPLADRCLADYDQHNSPRFVPERWGKVYRDWLVKLEDWCISRQLWWGHQIPAWYAVSETNGEIQDHTPFVVAVDEETARQEAIGKFGAEVQLQRDPDVLDTWFSSGLWPFSTLGWPEQTADLAAYYPTSTLVTGFDIIFFWVARMTMMAGYFTGQMPFQDVYIHGLVQDENGKKMSKSLNNGIDPLILIDECGTDALRYALIREVTGAGQDISLQLNRNLYNLKAMERSLTQALVDPTDLVSSIGAFQQNFQKVLSDKKVQKALGEVAVQIDQAKQQPAELVATVQDILAKIQKQTAAIEADPVAPPLSESVEASRNFTNKVWNAARFVMINLDGKTPQELGTADLAVMEPADRWIWSRFQQTIHKTRTSMERYGFGETAKLLYEFFWGDFCDWYIELVKSRLQPESPADSRQVAQQTLAQVLEGVLRLLHPFIPHITTEVWENLTGTMDLDLSLQSYPVVNHQGIDNALEEEFEMIFGVIRTIRNLRAEADIKPSIKAKIVLQSDRELERQALERSTGYICDTAKVEELQVVAVAAEDSLAIAGVHATVQVILPLTGVVDIGAFKVKLEKKLTKLQREAESSTNKLNNVNFVDRALPEVVQEVRDNLVELQKQIEILQARIASF
jgi:valyl-tRNA synthetase